MDDRTKLIAGGVALVAAVVIGIFVLSSSGDGGPEDGPREDHSGATGLSCTLGASGAALVADGLLKHKSASAIIAAVGGPAGAYGCNQAIKALVHSPDKPVDLTIKNSGGGAVDQTVTGYELQTPAPKPANPGLQRAVDCLRWQAQLFYDACVDGRLEPPSF